MSTLATMEARYGVSHLDHLDRDAELPVVSRLAFQGDVALIRDDTVSSNLPIPPDGYPVVKGEGNGNTHAVYGPGFFTPMQATAQNLALGVLTVPLDAQVLLSHPEHGGLLIGPGSYVLRRQREQAEIARLVAD